MAVFADSSALVKLYSDELGHGSVREVPAMVVSQLARVEVPAALWRKHRLGELEAHEARTLTLDFEADYYGAQPQTPRFVAIEVSATLLERAATLSATRGLRAYDAVQLSTALTTREVLASCTTFAAFDRVLRDAASAEGFALLPEELDHP